MQELSSKAKRFLAKQTRSESTIRRAEIIDCFIANKAPVFEPLIAFQQHYGGYEFMAGLAPINFGLLQGNGGYPKHTGTAIIDFSLSERADYKYDFVCATSQYQMQFTLDEYGRYFEDFEIVASSFGKKIEHMAILDDLQNSKDLKIVIENKRLGTQELDKKLGLKLIDEASDQYTLWFESETTYMTQFQGLTTIFTLEDAEKVKALIRV